MPQVKRDSVFISYSHKDSRFLQELQEHLKPLERHTEIFWWVDTRLEGGEQWRVEIREAIASAKLAVLLISHHFLASDFIAENELPPLLAAAENNHAVILPVILGPSLFERIEEIARYHALNAPSQPLVDLDEGERGKVWVRLAERILDTLGSGKISLRATATSQSQLLDLVKTSTTASDTEASHDQAPDLEILVSSDHAGDEYLLSYNLKAKDSNLGINYQLHGPVSLQQHPRIFLRDIGRDIALSSQTADSEIARRRLVAVGTSLMKQLLPPSLIQLLSGLVGNIETLRIVSDETWIPWEMLHLETGAGDAFLGEYFAIGRWLLDLRETPRLSMNSTALVVLEDGLANAASEAESITRLLTEGRRTVRVPAEYLALTDAFGSGDFDSWHIISHSGTSSSYPSRVWIALDENLTLTPEDLVGSASTFGKHRPLVFLSGPTLNGWADVFLQSGAGAVIGPYWYVSDLAALVFAENFYRSFLAGLPIGVAARDARLKVREKRPQDPSWLAFAVFGNPCARLK